MAWGGMIRKPKGRYLLIQFRYSSDIDSNQNSILGVVPFGAYQFYPVINCFKTILRL